MNGSKQIEKKEKKIKSLCKKNEREKKMDNFETFFLVVFAAAAAGIKMETFLFLFSSPLLHTTKWLGKLHHHHHFLLSRM